MKVLVTGTSQGIGKGIAELFLENGHEVVGLDRCGHSIEADNYTHIICDIRDYENLPHIGDVEILINNAGTQNEDDINVNLKSLIKVTEKYDRNGKLMAFVNVVSVEENIPINMELGEDITLYVSSERLHEVASAFTEEEMIVKIESDKNSLTLTAPKTIKKVKSADFSFFSSASFEICFISSTAF